MIWPALKKSVERMSKGIDIVPKWATQPWFPVFLQLAVTQPREISSTLLTLLGTKEIHHLSPKLQLLVVLCSNDIKEQNNLQTRLPIHYQQHGGKLPTQRI